MVFTLKDSQKHPKCEPPAKPKDDMLSKFIVGVIPLNCDVQTLLAKLRLACTRVNRLPL